MPVITAQLNTSHKVLDIELPLLTVRKIPLYSETLEKASAIGRELIAVVYEGTVHFIVIELT